MKINFRFIILWMALLIYGSSAIAQDIIVFNDGSVERTKILEINDNEVKYKKWDNLDGPLYSANKSTIMTINYQNGTSEKFFQQKQVEQQQFATTPDLKYDSDSPSYLRLGDRYLTEEEAIKLLYYDGESIYEDTWVGANKQRNFGKRMLFTGLGMFIGGSVTLGIGLAVDDGEMDVVSALAIPVASIGFACWIAGMIVNSIGNYRMSWTLKTYNNDIKHSNNKTTSLLFGATNNGIGLQLKF